MNILNFITTDATLSMPVSTYRFLLEKAALDERERIIKLIEEANWVGDTLADDINNLTLLIEEK